MHGGWAHINNPCAIQRQSPQGLGAYQPLCYSETIPSRVGRISTPLLFRDNPLKGWTHIGLCNLQIYAWMELDACRPPQKQACTCLDATVLCLRRLSLQCKLICLYGVCTIKKAQLQNVVVLFYSAGIVCNSREFLLFQKYDRGGLRNYKKSCFQK